MGPVREVGFEPTMRLRAACEISSVGIVSQLWSLDSNQEPTT